MKRFDHEFPERFADEIFHYLSIPAGPVASKMFEQPTLTRRIITAAHRYVSLAAPVEAAAPGEVNLGR